MSVSEVRRTQLAGEKSLGPWLEENGLAFDASRLRFAGRWLTPPFSPARFDNRFFLVEWRAEDGEPRVAPPESEEGEWIQPRAALARLEAGMALAAPPILHLLRVLSEVEPDSATSRLLDTSEANLGPLSLPLDGGVFDCPHCQARRRYVRRREEAYVSVCWVPVVPMGEGADFVECLACGGAFNEAATRPRDPSAEEELAERILRLMTLVMIRDGKADPAEMQVLLRFGAATRPIHEGDIWADIRTAQLLEADALSYAAHLRGLLSPTQLRLALRTAELVVAAGVPDPLRGPAYLAELAVRLGM